MTAPTHPTSFHLDDHICVRTRIFHPSQGASSLARSPHRRNTHPHTHYNSLGCSLCPTRVRACVLFLGSCAGWIRHLDGWPSGSWNNHLRVSGSTASSALFPLFSPPEALSPSKNREREPLETSGDQRVCSLAAERTLIGGGRRMKDVVVVSGWMVGMGRGGESLEKSGVA
jgi:hypothetical protein